MNKLIEFYKEEMGSDSDGSSGDDMSSLSGASSGSGGKLSSAKSSLESLADLGPGSDKPATRKRRSTESSKGSARSRSVAD